MDLSVDLDRGLVFLGQLAETVHDCTVDQEGLMTGFGCVVKEYIGKRVALEHVFFGRSLRTARIEESKLKAEVWRVQKIKAKSRLF